MVFVKYAEQDCTLITGNTKIEYGYNNDGIFYSEYGGNPVMKDPYKRVRYYSASKLMVLLLMKSLKLNLVIINYG